MAGDHRLRIAVLAFAVTGLAACGGGADAADDTLPPKPGGDDVERSSTTTEATTTVPADPVEAAILAGYRAGWEAFQQAMDPPNPDHPALAATSTGRALEQSRKYLGEIRDRGNALRGGMVLAPEIRERTADTAVIWDCVEDSTTEVPVDSAEGSGTPVPVGWEVRMKLLGATWAQEALFEVEEACSGR